MEDFRKTNLIVQVGENIHQLNSIDELIEIVLGRQYSKLTEEEKLLKRYELILPFSVECKKIIVHSAKGVIKEDISFDNKAEYDVSNSLFIDNEFTYFLSLCKLQQLQILEHINAEIFAICMDKSKISGNYILINKFADKLLQEHMKPTVNKEGGKYGTL